MTKIVPSTSYPVGMIAAEGDLPQTVIEACLSANQPLFVLAFDHNTTQPPSLEKVPHVILNIGAVGQALRALKAHHVKDIFFAGYMKRPKWSSLRPDIKGLQLLNHIRRAAKGDNALLSSILSFFEEHDFNVVGVDAIVPSLLVPHGALGTYSPDAEAQKDIQLGRQVLETIGHLDIGQGVIVQHGIVLGIEAAEGTDNLITRCSTLHQEGAGGVLVKCKKRTQDERIDLPTIGPKTIELAHQAKLQGIAVEAGSTLLIHGPRVREEANARQLFVTGF